MMEVAMYHDTIFIPGWQNKQEKLTAFEEGWRSRPYLCSEGYPTIGFGFRIGPQGASLDNYQFTLPRAVGEVWLSSILESVASEMASHPQISPALLSCNDARQAVLLSMAYQMGVSKLVQFEKTLSAIEDGRWTDAKNEVLDSKWASQTPKRASRHAEQILTGTWFSGYGIRKSR
ncbi:hypothetical protein P4S72_27270 [Vibrio sp. PP-XX7]